MDEIILHKYNLNKILPFLTKHYLLLKYYIVTKANHSKLQETTQFRKKI